MGKIKIHNIISNFPALDFLVQKIKEQKIQNSFGRSLLFFLYTLVPMHMYCFCWLALFLLYYYKVTNGTLLHCLLHVFSWESKYVSNALYSYKAHPQLTELLAAALCFYGVLYSPSKHFQRKKYYPTYTTTLCHTLLLIQYRVLLSLWHQLLTFLI